MELVIGAVTRMFVELIFHGLFYLIGWTVIKVVTLGRHPGPWRGLDSLIDAELVALVGLFVTVTAVIVTVKYFVP